MQTFRLPQDFYSIIYNQDTIITFPKDIITYWKFNKDEWFSHKSICCKEMISTYIKNKESPSFKKLYLKRKCF